MKTFRRGVLVGLLLACNWVAAKTVKYELNIENKPMNVSGKGAVDFALTVNGGIPAPILEFTEGDEAVITVNNRIANQDASIHWHGILLPNAMDGVPGVTTPAIPAGGSFTYRFPIRQNGTYWYHSHTMLQEQKGIFGAILIHPRKELITVDHDHVVLLNDWIDEDPDQVAANLRKDGDYYLYKKDTVRSYWGALQSGGLGIQLKNEWTRMGGMDLSDVGYDAFLINGRKDSQLVVAHPGERVRLRVINGGASTYFEVSLGGQIFEVVSADGIDIQPIRTKKIRLGMGETYDLIFTVPEHKNYELRATSQDGTGYASTWIGMGDKVPAQAMDPVSLYAEMDHGAHGADPAASHEEEHVHVAVAPSGHGHGGHMSHTEEPSPKVSAPFMEMVRVDDLKSPKSTVLPSGKKVTELRLVLGGDMHRYVWHINGKAIHEERNIDVHEGDIIRMTYVNETMMSHPMHLHGHFFRVLNSSGDLSPLKHTVDVPPHSERTIEFLADEPGQWMLHCHNLYHMMSGMARFVNYLSFQPSEEMRHEMQHDEHAGEHIYKTGWLKAATNQAQAGVVLSRTWDAVELHAEWRDYADINHLEGDVLYRRWFSNYFSLLGGGTYQGEFEDAKTRAMVGIAYTLPFLLESHWLVDHKGDLRLDLERRFQWTRRIFSDVDVVLRSKLKTEYEVTLMYGPSWHWSAGLMVTEDKAGVGAVFKF